MQQLVPMYIAIAFVVALSSKSEAKRGCALYGHSCYGGHGKRSSADQQPPDLAMGAMQPSISFSGMQPPMSIYPEAPMQNKEFININKEVPIPVSSLRSRSAALEHENKQLQYVIYDLLKQLMEYQRNSRNIEETENLNDVIFQRNK